MRRPSCLQPAELFACLCSRSADWQSGHGLHVFHSSRVQLHVFGVCDKDLAHPASVSAFAFLPSASSKRTYEAGAPVVWLNLDLHLTTSCDRNAFQCSSADDTWMACRVSAFDDLMVIIRVSGWGLDSSPASCTVHD